MKVSLILFCLVLLPLALGQSSWKAIERKPHTINYVQEEGVVQACHEETNQMYHVKYNNTRVDDEHVIVLDDVTGLLNITCDIDQTALFMQFSDPYSLMDFVDLLNYVTDFITGGRTHGCDIGSNTSKFVMRRVISGVYNADFGQIELVATEAKYDEIYQTADIQYSSAGSCSSWLDDQVCLGVNTQDCNSASSSIPIYQNQYVDVSCSNCFLGFTADVFLNLKIEWFKLQSLQGGFSNMAVNGAFVLDMNAQYAWSTGVSKNLNFAPPSTILSFWIGPVPFRITFGIPTIMAADASFHASAQASVGATATWNLGDLEVIYDSSSGWSHVTPSPTFAYTPIVQGSAQFNAEASFSLTPAVQMGVDNIYDYQVQFAPEIDFVSQGSTVSGQLCANLTYAVEIESSAQLNINIPWLDIHKSSSYGPNVLYNTGIQPIAGICESS